MKLLLTRLKTIRLWRYITAGILLLGISVDALYIFLDQNIQLSFQETLMASSGSVFSLYFLLLLIIADFGFDYQKTGALKQTFRSFWQHIRCASFLCFLFVLWLTACSFLALLLKTGTVTFNDTLLNSPPYGLENINASFAAFFNVLLLYLYFVFIAAVVLTINSSCKKRPLGYLGVLVISIFDAIVYTFYIFPSGFFPIEYASVGSALLATASIPISIVISVLYWLVLITATGLIYHIMNKRSKGGCLI